MSPCLDSRFETGFTSCRGARLSGKSSPRPAEALLDSEGNFEGNFEGTEAFEDLEFEDLEKAFRDFEDFEDVEFRETIGEAFLVSWSSIVL